jgi:hypothetical protein
MSFNFDKNNKEHIEFIKSLKLIDDLEKVEPNSMEEIKLSQYVNINHINGYDDSLEDILNKNTISFYT